MLDAAIIETKKIKIGKDAAGADVFVTVRGLNATDFAMLLAEKEDLMLMIFCGKFDWSSSVGIGKELLTKFPSLAYLAIALAIDEPAKATIVAQLPLPVQVELFSVVYKLTLPDGPGEAKKKLAGLMGILSKS